MFYPYSCKNIVVSWTKDYFDDTYASMFLAQIGQERTEEQVDLVTSVMGLEPPSIIADIGCGLGRHSIELAKRGFTVQGFDSNPNYLKQATEDAVAEGVSDAFFIHMDMREFDHTKTFDALISIWVSFGYFDDATNEDIFDRMVKSIKSGGSIFIDVENREYILQHYIPERWRMKEDSLLLERSQFDHARSVNKCRRTIIKHGIKKTTTREIRLYSAHEIVNLAKKHGLMDIRLLGDWDGSHYSVRSPRLMLTARTGI